MLSIKVPKNYCSKCDGFHCSSWLVVRGLASPLASYLLTPACVGTPAGNAGSGNPICKRTGGSTNCSVEAFNVNSLESCGC